MRVVSFSRRAMVCAVCLLSACVAAHDVTGTHEGSVSARKADGGMPDGGGALHVANLPAPVAITDQQTEPEGPVWSPKDSALYYTDITLDGIYRLTLPDTVDVIMMPAQHPDGLALDQNGELVVAGYSGRSVWRLHDGKPQTLADKYDGRPLNTPDDLVVRADGTIYFTDPTYGLDITKGQKSDSGIEGVYRIAPDGSLHLEDSSESGPNGIAFSPDQHLLYVSYTLTGDIAMFDVAQDGSLSNRQMFVTGALGADSMTVDSAGNVYVATVAGISVYGPDGAPLGAIKVNELTSNVSFGGADQRTLFITARSPLASFGIGTGVLYRIDGMPVPGIAGQP
jgi:gluconolactonase